MVDLYYAPAFYHTKWKLKIDDKWFFFGYEGLIGSKFEKDFKYNKILSYD